MRIQPVPNHQRSAKAGGPLPIGLKPAAGDVFIRFGNVGNVQPVEPQQVTFTENVGLDMDMLRDLSMGDPELTWPLYLMRTLLRDPEVRSYLEDQCKVRRFDLQHGIHKMAMPKVRQYGRPRTMNDAEYDQWIRQPLKKFAAGQGETSVTPLLVWRWLMKTNPNGRLDDLLNACKFEQQTVQDVPVGPLDNDAIQRLKAAPEPPKTLPVDTLRPLTKEEIIAFDKATESLPHEVIGQDEAVMQLIDDIRIAREGLDLDPDKPNRPLVRVLLLGPSGVGKTFTAKKLAKKLGQPVVYVPFNQYGEKGSSSNFGGSAQGYVGSKDENVLREIQKAVEKYRRGETPRPMVILDELEKADKSVLRNIMQALDEGVMYLNDRTPIYFRDCDIVMTSNIAQKRISEAQAQGASYDKLEEIAEEEMAKAGSGFPGPPGITIIFRSLTKESAYRILDLKLNQLIGMTRERYGLELTIDPSLKDRLVAEGYNPQTNVRELDRQVAKDLLRAFVKEIQNARKNDISLAGQHMTARWENGKTRFDMEAPENATDTPVDLKPVESKGEPE